MAHYRTLRHEQDNAPQPVPETERAALFTSVTNALSASTGSTKSAIAVLSAFESVLQIADAAFRAHARSWNGGGPHILARVPDDVLLECFRYLDFTGCIYITHVSHRWRRIALSASTLWATITRVLPNAAIFQEWLNRSGAAPLSISTGGYYLNDSIVEAIVPQMSRVVHLRFEGYDIPSELLQTPIPALKSFFRRDSCTSWPISNIWATTMRDTLHTLALHDFILPAEIGQFPALRSFSGYLGPRSHARRLFETFPKLQRLQLLGIAEDSIIPTSRPPVTLRTLHLHAYRTGFDFEPLTRNLIADHPLQELFVTVSRSWLSPLALFAASHNLPWSLEFNTIIDAVYLRASKGFEYVIRMSRPEITRGLLLAEPYFSRLTSITVPYLDLLRMLTSNVTMPALGILSITHIDPLLRAKVYAESPAQLHVPKLRVLELVQHQEYTEFRDNHRRDDDIRLRAWVAKGFPAALQQQVVFTSAALERLALVGPAFVGANAEELAAMSRLAPYDVRNWDSAPSVGTLPRFGEL